MRQMEEDMENVIIILILAVLILFGISATIKHFKGEGGCCGGGGKTVREVKHLTEPVLGEKKLRIEGMYCENCRNAVERAVNHLDGAACTVNLRKKTAVVSYSKPVEDEKLKEVIEKAGFQVISIQEK